MRWLEKAVAAGTKKQALAFLAAAMLVFWGVVGHALAVVKYAGDWRGFFRLGSGFYHPTVMQDVPRDSPWGYDGQFYAALAADPWLCNPETQKALDNPSYRAQRMLLPALAWVLALGNGHAALWWYLALVWLLALGSVLIVAWWLMRTGVPVLWALPLPVTAGLVTSLTRATPDGAAVTLLLGALLALEWRKWGWGGAFLAAAVLARETTLLLVPAVLLWQWREKHLRRGVLLVIPALVAFFGWRVYLHLQVGSAFSTKDLANFGFPLAWLPWKIRQVFAAADINGVEVLGLVALLATVGSLAFAVHPGMGLWELAYLAFGLLGLVLGPSVITEAYAYSRVLLVLSFLAVVLAVKAQLVWRKTALFAVPVLWGLLGLVLVRGEMIPHGGVIPVFKALLIHLARL